MAYETILYEKTDGIARITLNRPEKLNALNNKLRTELIDAVNDSGRDADVRVIVIKGAGRAFSSGYDIGGGGGSGGREEGARKSQVSSIQRDIDGMMDGIVEPWTRLWAKRLPTPSVQKAGV